MIIVMVICQNDREASRSRQWPLADAEADDPISRAEEIALVLEGVTLWRRIRPLSGCGEAGAFPFATPEFRNSREALSRGCLRNGFDFW